MADVSVPRGAPFLTHIRLALDSMPPIQQRLGAVVLEDPVGTARLTITQLADRVETSAATVTRFYRSLGLTSYSQLRVELATAGQDRAREGEPSEIAGDLQPGDDLADIIDRLSHSYARMIDDTARLLDPDVVRRVVEAIASAGQIRIFGMASGGTVGLYLQEKLRSLGMNAISFRDPRDALIDVANGASGDVLVIISRSGATEDARAVLQVAEGQDMITVAITGDDRSPIGRRVDHVLRGVVGDPALRTGLLSTRHIEIWLVDCLCAALVMHRYQDSAAALARVDRALDQKKSGRSPANPPTRTKG